MVVMVACFSSAFRSTWDGVQGTGVSGIYLCEKIGYAYVGLICQRPYGTLRLGHQKPEPETGDATMSDDFNNDNVFKVALVIGAIVMITGLGGLLTIL